MLNQKRQNERARREQGREREQSRLSTPVKGTLCWALLCNPPPPFSLQLNPPSIFTLPSKAPVDFSLNAIRNVTGPIHGQMEGWLCGWRPIPSLENDRNLGCGWRSGRVYIREPDRKKLAFFVRKSTFFFLPVLITCGALSLWFSPVAPPLLAEKGKTASHLLYSKGTSVFSLPFSEAPPSKTSLSPFEQKKKKLLKELRAL